jgi:hypothetical protein
MFQQWITPDMEKMAEQMNPPEINPKDIEGHLPAPEKEENPQRVVRMEAWNKLRLAIVSVEDEGIIFKDRGVMTFKNWVDLDNKDEVSKWEARGAAQAGGLNLVSPKDVKGLKEPPDVKK